MHPDSYLPRARVRLMDARSLQAALDVLGADADRLAVYARVILQTRSARVLRRRMPDDPAETARQLPAVLRAFDDQQVRLIWVETPPATPEWECVHDQLRAALAP